MFTFSFITHNALLSRPLVLQNKRKEYCCCVLTALMTKTPLSQLLIRAGVKTSLPVMYRWIQVFRRPRLWLVYLQPYVPVCLGMAVSTSSRLFSFFTYFRLKAVVNQRTESFAWQLRLKAEPAVRTLSDWFGWNSEFRRMDGGPGGSGTENSKCSSYWR